ncbi:putative ribosome biogenesis protein C8F11.04 [Cyphellophora attinorum]|uniref:Putative ribosome biogenesis protein C8F11.04 n=1 Tax=Cyphellophora attinorum TaxID=1664694 RepID=A0A0N0NQ62_9EURO|nr:putative ribosome biogenesis protein C8F11.04 [Phialophora attinorum]KPI43538.1 putative ribosome biogenesis protein C8F11.04 [Phialophora attinorum]
MALTTHVAKSVAFATPYQLDPEQTLKASQALLAHLRTETKKLQSSTTKRELLKTDDSESESEAADSEQAPIWLTLTTKQHIIDKNRLRPTKIAVPHSLNASPNLTICIISADPQRALKNAVADDSFPKPVSDRITRIVGFEKLKSRYKSFEQRRALRDEHDIFLADDRIISRLPEALGKVFYKGTSKRPIPVDIAVHDRQDGKRVKTSKGKNDSKIQANNVASPQIIAKEVSRAISAVPVNLKPGTSTAVRVGLASFTPEQLVENINVVVQRVIENHVAKGWRNVKSIHVKSPTSTALPIWLADELWADQDNVEAVGAYEEGKGAQQASLQDASQKRKRSQHTKKGPQTGQRKRARLSDVEGQSLSAEKAKAFSEATKAVMV